MHGRRGGKRAAHRRLRALEEGWNARSTVSESRNNGRVHEMHRAYFDKVPGQRYVSINYDLYGMNVAVPPKPGSLKGSRSRKGASRRRRGSGSGMGAGTGGSRGQLLEPVATDPTEFLVVVHVVSTVGERLSAARVTIHARHTGDVVGYAVTDATGRAVVVCHFPAWTAVPFFLEASAPGFVPAGLDFEVTARECAAQLALESEEEVARREAMERLEEEEARRLARQRFTVQAHVVHLSSKEAVVGATVIVRTAHHGTMCGQAVTDGKGVALVSCLHPHWQTAPLRAEVAIRGYVPASADLRAVAGSSVMETRLLVETEAEVAARNQADTAKFTVVVAARDADTGAPLEHATVVLSDPHTKKELGQATAQLDGKARIEARHGQWSTAPFMVTVTHEAYPHYQEVIHMSAQQQRFVMKLTSVAAIQARREAAAASLAEREAALKAEEELKRAEAVEAVGHVVDHARLTDDEFVLAVYAVSLRKGVSLARCHVSLLVKATGQMVGDGWTDDGGKADVVAQLAGWRHTEFLLMCDLEGYTPSAKTLVVGKSSQLVRVALERVSGGDERKEDFQVTAHVIDAKSRANLSSARVLLKVRATGDVLADAHTNTDGVAVLRATLARWYEEAMYLHVAATGYSSAASDVNMTSNELVTEVGLDSEADAAAKRMARAYSSTSGRAQRSRFRVRVKVVDASTKAPVEGAAVRLAVASSGKEVETATSDEAGVAVINAHHRRWDSTPMVLEAAKAGWVSIPQRLVVGSADYPAQVVLAKPTEEDHLRVILTWVEDPQDLDLHLMCPSGTDVSFKYRSDATMGVALEVDDRSGFGPETIAMACGKADTWYRVAVHNFSKDVSIMKSSAQVAIVVGSQLRRLFHVPSSSSTNEWWDVCGIHGRTGRIVETNYLVVEQPRREQGLRGVPAEASDDADDDDDDDW